MTLLNFVESYKTTNDLIFALKNGDFDDKKTELCARLMLNTIKESPAAEMIDYDTPIIYYMYYGTENAIKVAEKDPFLSRGLIIFSCGAI